MQRMNNPANQDRELEKRVHDRILQAKDVCYAPNGRNADNELEGDYGTWQDWEDLIVALIQAERQEAVKSALEKLKKKTEKYINDWPDSIEPADINYVIDQELDAFNKKEESL